VHKGHDDDDDDDDDNNNNNILTANVLSLRASGYYACI